MNFALCLLFGTVKAEMFDSINVQESVSICVSLAISHSKKTALCFLPELAL
jgi:hypothetical protein